MELKIVPMGANNLQKNVSKTFVFQNKRGIIYLKMVYGYIRVSTDKQTVEHQRHTSK